MFDDIYCPPHHTLCWIWKLLTAPANCEESPLQHLPSEVRYSVMQKTWRSEALGEAWMKLGRKKRLKSFFSVFNFQRERPSSSVRVCPIVFVRPSKSIHVRASRFLHDRVHEKTAVSNAAKCCSGLQCTALEMFRTCPQQPAFTNYRLIYSKRLLQVL